MKLYIDTTHQNGFLVALIDDQCKIAHSIRVNTSFCEAELLTPTLVQLLREASLAFFDISEMWVITGPGGFTAVRIGVTVANALAFALRVSVRGVQRHAIDEAMESLLKRLLATEPTSLVAPIYDRPPNITQSKL